CQTVPRYRSARRLCPAPRWHLNQRATACPWRSQQRDLSPKAWSGLFEAGLGLSSPDRFRAVSGAWDREATAVGGLRPLWLLSRQKAGFSRFRRTAILLWVEWPRWGCTAKRHKGAGAFAVAGGRR